MHAKALALIAAALAVAGCSGALKRFAPPGIVKYEELAGDEPVDPAVAARMEEAQAADGAYPVLSRQPQKRPEGIAKPEREAMEEQLIAERDELKAEVAADRAAADAERMDSLEAVRDSLAEAAARDDERVRRERGLPPRDADEPRQ